MLTIKVEHKDLTLVLAQEWNLLIKFLKMGKEFTSEAKEHLEQISIFTRDLVFDYFITYLSIIVYLHFLYYSSKICR